MDILPVIEQAIEQALGEVGIAADDDPEFVAMLQGAAPFLARVATQLRDRFAPELPRNGAVFAAGPEEAQPGEVEDVEPPEPGTLAYDIAEGIPVFIPPWPYE